MPFVVVQKASRPSGRIQMQGIDKSIYYKEPSPSIDQAFVQHVRPAAKIEEPGLLPSYSVLCNSEMATSMVDDVEHKALSTWLASRGVKCAKCRLRTFVGSGGRGVAACHDIEGDEDVIIVPDDAVLMPENCSIADVFSVHFSALHSVAFGFQRRLYLTGAGGRWFVQRIARHCSKHAGPCPCRHD